MGIFDSVILADISMINAGIVGLIFIAIVVSSVMAAKHWHWVNIVFLILTFMASVGAITGLTTVYHKRMKVMNEAKFWTDRAEASEAAANLVEKGDRLSAVYDKGSLRQLDEAKTRLMYGTGRVWPAGQVAVDGENRVFTFSSPRPGSDSVGSLQDIVLFAFLDMGSRPARYVGSVRVTQDTPQSLKIEEVALADPNEFGQPSGTWTLFEKMPQDRHGIFKRAIISAIESDPTAPQTNKEFAENLAGPIADLDISLYRDVLESNYLKADQIGYDPESVEYEQLIDSYAFDGLNMGTIQNWINANSTNRKSLRFEPVPAEVFFVYRFNLDATNPVQVDTVGSLENDGLFSPLGLAVYSDLKLGHPVMFKKNDQVLVDQPSAEGYQRGDLLIPPFVAMFNTAVTADGQKVVEKINEVYVRQMRDFPFEFGDLRIQSEQVTSETQRVTEAIVIQAETLSEAAAQIVTRSALTADRDSDQSNLKNDLESVSRLSSEMAEEVKDLGQVLSSHETKIDELYAELRGVLLKQLRDAYSQTSKK